MDKQDHREILLKNIEGQIVQIESRVGYEETKLDGLKKEKKAQKNVELDAMRTQLTDLVKYQEYVYAICKEERTKS